MKILQNPQKILKVFCYTPIAKPLNGSLPRSNNSHFLKLYPASYSYGRGKEKNTVETQTYMIKGLRGCLRHQAMETCNAKGLAVCHSTDKEMSKDGTPLLPEGFHLLGSCRKNGGSCILHTIFGSKGNEGKISVFAHPISAISHKTYEINIKVQNVQIATENRLNKTFGGISAQNFGERYFSGAFEFEIDVSRCSSEELGLLIEVIISLQKLGRGYNSGYGRINVRKFQLLERSITRKSIWDENDAFIIKELNVEKPLKEEVFSALQEWERYVSSIAG